jgi:hypothetical protein
MTVDNSDYAFTRLTAHLTLLMISELFLPHLSNSEDSYGPSCTRVPARGLSPACSDAARASLLVPFSAFLHKRCGQAQQAPPSAQAPLPRRLSRLSSRLHSLVECRGSTCSCTPLVRGEKPAGSTQASTHRGLRLSQPRAALTSGSLLLTFTRLSAMASVVRLSTSRRSEDLLAARRSALDATPPCTV